MEINDIKDFHAHSLGVKAPWRVAAVSILGDKRRVEVRVECREGTVWTDPETRQQAHVHGWRERRWRHLDTCEFETVVITGDFRARDRAWGGRARRLVAERKCLPAGAGWLGLEACNYE